MFKEIQRGFLKFFTNQRTIILVIFLILAWAILAYSGAKSLTIDTMDSMGSPVTTTTTAPVVSTAHAAPQKHNAPAVEKHDALRPVANPSDLLPVDSNSQWAALNPNTMTSGNVVMPDLLQAGYHIGLDTIGQTLRNANYQLRSDPVIPKSDIGPWNQSTIEPDLGRVPLEIGQGPQ